MIHLLSKVGEKKIGSVKLSIFKREQCGKETKTPRIMLLTKCEG